MATGLTGDQIHGGSWNIGGLQLPDIGLTEKISDLAFGQGARTGLNTSGGSDLVMDKYQNPNTADLSKTGYNYVGEQAKAPYSSVKGVNTSQNTTNNQTQQRQSGGGGGGGDFMQFYAGWNPEAARADFMSQYGGDFGRLAAAKGGGGGGGGEADLASMISDMYAPALNALAQIESSLMGSRDTGITNTETDYTTGKDTINREQSELQASLDDQSRRLEKSGQSAFAEAVRNLNSLFQGLASRFGAGSSAGLAAGELVGQEFLRNQGKMREQLEQGRQQIGQETTKMKNYITDKVGQLDKWKRDAVAKINENFQNSMNEIAMRRGDIEANKTRDRISALQDAVNRARDVENREREFKMGLAQFAVETLQSTSARNFSPEEIAGVVNDMLGQNISGFQSNTAVSTPTLYNRNQFKSKEDELRALNPLG